MLELKGLTKRSGCYLICTKIVILSNRTKKKPLNGYLNLAKQKKTKHNYKSLTITLKVDLSIKIISWLSTGIRRPQKMVI